MRHAIKTHRFALLCLCVSIVIIGSLYFYATNPSPIVIRDTINDATIYFEVKQSFVLGQKDCYTVSWDVQGIKTVYLNQKGKVGQGEDTLCYADTNRPELRVVFSDDTDQVYDIEINLLEADPVFWELIAVALLFSLTSITLITAPKISQRIGSRRAFLQIMIRGTVLTVMLLGFVFTVLELGLRFYFTTYGTQDELVNYIYSSEEIQAQTSRLSGAPYVLYTNNPHYPGHNSLGYRGEEITLEKPDGVFRIVTLGASTTYGFGLNNNQTYPFLLERTLHENYGYTHVQVINGGVPGYTSYEVLTNFLFRIVELDPDLIIYYGAKNDAETRFEDPGCYNSPTNLYGLSTYQGMWQTRFADLPPSTLYRYLAVNAGWIRPPNSKEFALVDIPLEDECRSLEKYEEAELLELNRPIFAERNFRNLLGAAQQNEIAVMVSRFVHPTEIEQVGGDANLLMSDGLRQSTQDINDLYRFIAEDMGVYYYDLESDFDIQPGMFWTNVHMTVEGTKQQARLYAAFLVENHVLPPLDSSG